MYNGSSTGPDGTQNRYLNTCHARNIQTCKEYTLLVEVCSQLGEHSSLLAHRETPSALRLVVVGVLAGWRKILIYYRLGPRGLILVEGLSHHLLRRQP